MSPEMEAWKPVIGYEGRYEVSDHGRVRALFFAARGRWKPGRIMTHKIGLDGYSRLNLYDKDGKLRTKTVHSIVLESFSGRRPIGYVTRHLDGNRQNNHKSNLTWGTPSENSNDMRRHGNSTNGEKAIHAKLNREKVIQLRELWQSGFPISYLTNKYSICAAVAWKIATYRSWKHVPP